MGLQKNYINLLPTRFSVGDILDKLNTVFCFADRDWKYRYLNRAALQMLGKTREELLGKTMWEVFPNAVGGDFYRACLLAVREQQEKRLENHLSVFGIWLETVIQPSPDGVALLSKDISDRKRLEQEFQLTHERLEVATSAAQMGVWEMDLLTKKIFWSDQCQRIFGLIAGMSKETYDHFRSLVHPEDWQLVEESLRWAIDTRQASQLEYRIVNPAKTVHWVRSYSVVHYDQETLAPIKIVGSVMNIDDQKQTEFNLKFLAQLSKILSSTRDLQATYEMIAELAVESFADFVLIDILEEKGSNLKREAVGYADPKFEKAANLLRDFPPHNHHPLRQVIVNRKPAYCFEITDEVLRKIAHGQVHWEAMKSLEPTSFMILPLHFQENLYGAITFITTGLGRRYKESDLLLAEEVANRASIAIDNAKLLAERQKFLASR